LVERTSSRNICGFDWKGRGQGKHRNESKSITHTRLSSAICRSDRRLVESCRACRCEKANAGSMEFGTGGAPLTFAGPSQHEARRNCQTLLLRIARAGSKLRRDRGRPGLAGASALSMREKIVGATGIEPVTPAILPLPPSPNSNKNLSQLPILTKTHRFQEASVASSVPTLTRLQ
jgi:hypothetical protein